MKRTQVLLFHLSCILLLLVPAFYNGFPLVYSDTGTYILSGMDLMVPRDRPVFYGLFIRFASMGWSLWPVVLLQAFLIHYVLFGLFRRLRNRGSHLAYFGILFFLVAFTGVGWYTGQIMPDIFSALTILTIPLLLLRKQVAAMRFAITAIIFMASILAHGSNFFIAFLVLTALGIFLWIKKRNYKKDFALVVLMLFLTIPIAGLLNLSISGSFDMGRGGHVYLIGKMHDSGVLEQFLKNECASHGYELCAFRDSMPADSRKLLWDADSPIEKMGGWQKSKAACWEVLRGIATHPKYLAMYFYNSAYSSISQLFQNNIGSGLVSDWYANPDSPPAYVIGKYFPQERLPYLQSRQNTNLWGQGLDFSLTNALAYLILLGSVALLIFWGFSIRHALNDTPVAIILVAGIAGVISNAIVTASLANVYDRLQARVSWIIVLMALLVLLNERKNIYSELKRWSRS